MGSPDMTSVSVSFEVRRQLNSMRALENYQSVDELIQHLLKAYRLSKLNRDSESLQDSLNSLDDVDVDALVSKLQLSPFKA
ncbi:MAG TPA: hypothetical protein QF621_03270 [Candidatus Thalassarchaeaceae archaeon]|jgi:Arc/MetJ-type ribon-helix-helix transcriptional regulator|nr:hypothetical protein [Candidatus Thalassarchaeaceae archaeon]HJL59351.1 hypothetical protein [Candidatus Thalassarchaeaceae archaeon]